MTKLDASGGALDYSTYLGGSGGDAATASRSTPAARLRDRATAADFPTTAGAFDTTYNGGADAFVTKLDATGAALVYSTYLGGSEHDDGTDRGRRRRERLPDRVHGSTDFPTTPGAFDTTYNGGPRRLRDEARPERRRPRLLDLPRRQRPRRLRIAVDGTGSAYLTGHGRPTSRRPRARSTRPTTAAATPS